MAFYKSPRINLGRLMTLIGSLLSQFNFLQETNILPKSQMCDTCNQELSIPKSRGNFVYYKCSKCKTQISSRKGTILAHAKISFRRFILLAYSFCQFNWTYDQTKQESCITSDESDSESSGGRSLSNKTISKFFTLFREIICDYMYESLKTVTKIGGPGLTVEIDESQFGKRKYHRGTIVGRRFAWVLGGICRETGEMFLVQCPDNKRDRPTLEKLILDHVEKGTKIYTDGWASYKVFSMLLLIY